MKCPACNGTGYKDGVVPLDWRDHPDAGRLVFEKCPECKGTGEPKPPPEYRSCYLDGTHKIERVAGVWQPCGMSTVEATKRLREALTFNEQRAETLREILEQWEGKR